MQRLDESFGFLRSVTELGRFTGRDDKGQAGNSSRLLLQRIEEMQHALSSIRQFPSLAGSAGRVLTAAIQALAYRAAHYAIQAAKRGELS